MHTAVNHFNGNDATPRDLRSDGPAAAGAGKTYPVDPVAVQRLKAHVNGKKTAAAATPAETDGTAVGRGVALVDPEPLYPASVIAAAKAQEQATGRRNLAKVLTDEVLAIWDGWNQSGTSMNEIGKKEKNGLLELASVEVSRYLRQYRKRLAKNTTAEPTETAVAPPAPELPAEPEAAASAAPQAAAVTEAPTNPETAVAEQTAEPFTVQKPENLPAWLDRNYAPPRPGPGDALAALAALVNNEQLRVRGSVKLNLEIEFGE